MTNQEIEMWSPAVGYEGYEISNLGRVRSWRARYRHPKPIEPHIVTGSYDKDGYRRVIICLGDGKQVYRSVRRLVAEAWIGPRPAGANICHDNGDNKDDRASNLVYKTQLENIHDKFRHGTIAHGEKNSKSVLTATQVAEIYQSPLGCKKLGKQYGVWPQTIRSIKIGKTWRRVTESLKRAV